MDGIISRQTYAHTTPNLDKSDWQLLSDHLNNVAKLSEQFATDFNSGEWGYTCGLLHDIGKYSGDFQKRLEGSHIKVDHSTAGAQEALKLFHKSYGQIFAYAISGHHGGLLNYGSNASGLCERLKKVNIPDYSYYEQEVNNFKQNVFKFNLNLSNESSGFCISFFIRMLYSCLVDADSLDTEKFVNPEKSLMRGGYESFYELSKKFEDYMKVKQFSSENNWINTERKKIFEQCIEAADLPQQLFTLTVPTGGGKTLSSMAFALRHAQKYNLQRIFYVMPYTSIIEQNADVFRNIFGNVNVLEHHSNFDVDKIVNDDYSEETIKLCMENWDVPIVVTTNVQFFESLFSNKRSKCRKLHNLSKSVIIFDEAQMLPTGYLQPCLSAISELVRNYGSTVIMCTATQPEIGKLLQEDIIPHEIVESPERLYELFKRVQVTQLGEMNDVDLAMRLQKCNQVLCIVNTRKHAQKLFEKIESSGNCYHLSARMCPVHRREKIAEIKKCLKEGNDCKVISTQLIEAGVDIDFPVVYRIMTGVDSIAQAAGRCNREGKITTGEVFIFKSTEEYSKNNSQNIVSEVGEIVIDGCIDPLSLEVVAKYFERLYHYKEDGGLDVKKILPLLEERCNEIAFPFEEVSDVFTIIRKGMKDIIIPYNDAAKMFIKNLYESEFIDFKIIRKLQGYSVQIYPGEFKELERLHAIDSIDDRFYILKSCDGYSDKTGLLNVQDRVVKSLLVS